MKIVLHVKLRQDTSFGTNVNTGNSLIFGEIRLRYQMKIFFSVPLPLNLSVSKILLMKTYVLH